MMRTEFPDSIRESIRAEMGLADLRVVSTMVRPGSQLWRICGTIDGEPQKLVVKVRRYMRPEDEAEGSKRERVIREYEALARSREVFEPHAGILVPRPILCLPDQLALVLEEEEGQTLQHLVLQQARQSYDAEAWARLARGFRAAGRGLRLLQERSERQGEALDLQRLTRYNEGKLARLESLGSIKPGLAAAIREENSRLAAGPLDGRERTAVGTHGDYCPGNILLHGESIVVLDFGMTGNGSIYQDLTYCHEYLERYLIRYRSRVSYRAVRRLQAALLEGYDSAVRATLPLFRLGQIRHHLNYLLSMHEPETGIRRWLRIRDRFHGRRNFRIWLKGRSVSPVAGRD